LNHRCSNALWHWQANRWAKARLASADRYNEQMMIVIENALPPEGFAPSLATEIERRHPWLIEWFAGREPVTVQWPWREHGCTPSEGLGLQLAQCPVVPGQPLGSALGPYLAGVTLGNQTVWLADMCSTIIGQDRAAILALPYLGVTQAESDALWQAAQPLFDGHGQSTGFELERLSTGRGRILGPLPAPDKTISPMALDGQDVGDWWPTGSQWQPWRRLLNELQMTWHEHPVNEARLANGQAPINGVWLYGGAQGWQPLTVANTTWCNALSESAREGDWHRWIESWQDLNTTLLAADPSTEVVLLGADRWVHLKHAPTTWWRSLLGSRKAKAWTNWWIKS